MMSSGRERTLESGIEKPQPWHARGDESWLLFSVLVPPSAWALHLGVSFALVDAIDATESKAVLYAVSAVLVLCCAAGAVAAEYAVKHLERQRSEPESRLDRVHFMAQTAFAFATFFAVVILAQTLSPMLFGFGD